MPVALRMLPPKQQVSKAVDAMIMAITISNWKHAPLVVDNEGDTFKHRFPLFNFFSTRLRSLRA